MSSPTARPPADAAVRSELTGALETGFAVGAGAGSGKTRVLVDRVIALVDEGHRLERIVAITFTDKAAGELRERVRAQLARDPESGGDEVRRNRRQALDQVDLAQLTTIHGFCRSILNVHPLEAGITPGFTVLDPLQAGLLLDAAVQDVTEEWLTDGGNELESLLLWGSGPAVLDRLVRALIRFPDLSPAEASPPPDKIEAFVQDLLATTDQILSFAAGIDPTDRLLRQALDISDAAGHFRPTDLPEVIRMKTLRDLEIVGGSGSQAKWGDHSDVLRGLKESWRDLRERRDQLVASFRNRLLGWLVDRAARARAVYEDRKRELGALDFDDLLLRTEALLGGDRRIAAAVADAFDTILVDEFQDTDPIQARIIRLLAAPPEEIRSGAVDPPPGPGRLFLVGDANQGIYRFRRADLRIFEEVRQHLLTTGKRADLRVNFRSTPGLVELANCLFEELLGKERYQPLQPHRREGPEGPSVTLLDLDPLLAGPEGQDGGSASTDAVREAEARALAWWIRQKMEEGWLVPDRESGELRPMAYADVAVLIRAQSGVKVFEDVFEQYGIRYRLSGGKAFFARLEVQQTLSVLEALSDPGNEQAVVAALRSPYFGVSDESLVRWAASGQPFSYLGREGDPSGEEGAVVADTLDRKEDAPLLAALQFLRGLHARSIVCAPSATVRDLFARSRGLPLHLLKPDGDRRMANLLKLLDLAAAYEEAAEGLEPGTGEGDLRGLVRHLKEQQKAAVEEESALVDEKSDAVTIMTIHKAKGLEFPVVAILDRAFTSTFRDDAIPDRENDTVHLKVANLEPSDWPDWKKREKESQEEEARRLLYVAFTRAREHVVICSSRSIPPAEKAFLAPLERVLTRAAEEEKGLIGWSTPAVEAGRKPTPHRLPFDLKRPKAADLKAAVEQRASRHASRCRAVTAATSPVVRSASSLAGETDWSEVRPSSTARRYALRRGSLVHKAMEQIVRNALDAEAAVAVAGLSEDPDRMVAEAVGMARTGKELLHRSIAEGWQVVGVEWPLMLGNREVLEGIAPGCDVQVVTGVADLILSAADGRLRVVDFKTDDSGDRDLTERYGPQLGAYRAALASATGDDVSAQIWDLASGTRIDIS